MATPATVIVTERYGAPAGTEGTITNCNMGNVEGIDLTISKTTAITAGEFSFEKWHRFKVTAFNDATDIGGFRVWASAALSGTDVHWTSAKESSLAATAYAQPVGGATQSTVADQVMPVAEPTLPNVSVGGDHDATLATGGGANQYSDYMIMQIEVKAATTTGKAIMMNYQYDEYS